MHAGGMFGNVFPDHAIKKMCSRMNKLEANPGYKQMTFMHENRPAGWNKTTVTQLSDR